MQVIKVEHLSKQYAIGGSTHNTLRDAVGGFFRRNSAPALQIFSALDDISFTVNEGETLGIIGSNGAGKSTLLKILSRITKPTSGSAEIRGRVGSLLEVGTGFHNELSGRENIYLNGAILGMKRSEIESKFAEIVEFSEIEKFLDTPVKHYSSGMYMRLAFSIAAHLEPEVLIVDEVLAVGDASFQKKCLGKMREVGEKGRTVIFVSHDMNAITRLCDRVIWLKDGTIRMDDEAKKVVGAYFHEQANLGAERTWEDGDSAPGNEYARLKSLRVCDENGESIQTADIRRPIGIEMTYQVLKTGKVMVPNLHFFDESGTCIFASHDWDSKWRTEPRTVGRFTSTVWIPGNFLSEGSIFVGAAVTTYEPLEVHFVEWGAVTFNVIDSLDGDSARGDYAGLMPGVVRPVLRWENK